MRNKNIYGLVGKNINYSFSKGYFLDKFKKERIFSCDYLNFDLDRIDLIEDVFRNNLLSGLNVTIPYKEKIIPYIDELCPIAKEIGSVNTICFENGKKVGYNTDIHGFTESLKVNKIDNIDSVLILGTGGAAKTISYFCKKNSIPYSLVSRQSSNLNLTYNDLNENLFSKKVLIVNCTPVGTFPKINSCPELPYELIKKENIFFDLVYNPPETLFMKKGTEIGCKTLNGYEMLEFQAEMSWKLWTKTFK